MRFIRIAALLAAAVAAAPAGAATEIVGTWRIAAIGALDVPAEAGLTIAFEAGGTFSGSTGCNAFSGSYTMKGDALELGPIRITQRGCEPAAAARENRLMLALGTARTVEAGERGVVLGGAGADRLVLARG